MNCRVARWLRSLGNVHWPQIWDLPERAEDWWTRLAERTQQYADMGDMHAVYEALLFRFSYHLTDLTCEDTA